MATAQIVINGTPGSNDNITFGDTVNLSNNNNTGVVTYLWTLVSKPAGSAAALSNPTDDAPTFVADAEGTYLIHLTVNSGLPDEASDQVIAGVRELQTGNRIPAAGETIENNAESGDTGWAHEAVDQILQRVTRMEDAGYVVCYAGEELTVGSVVRFTGLSTIASPGPDVRKVPRVAKANGTNSDHMKATLGYVTGGVTIGSPTIPAGELCRVLLNGVFSTSVGGSVNSSVYVTSAGLLTTTPSATGRIVGTVVADDTFLRYVAFSGFSALPHGAAGGDLTGNYPNPTVARINGTAIGTAGGLLVTGRVLRVTGTTTADWGAVDLANANAVTGALLVGRGGTGAALTLTPGSVIYASTASAMAQTAPGTAGYLLKSNGASAPTWLQTVPVANGGTGTSTPPTQYGVIYAATVSDYASTAAATSTNTVLRGNNAGAPTWGTVPSGAFATASIPYSSLQTTGASNQVSSGIVTVDTTAWTPLINYVDWPVKQGVFVFGIIPMFATAAIPAPIMLNKVTCLANNHSAKISVRYTITGPNDNWNPDGATGFRNVRVYEQEFNFAQSSAGHIVGSVPFSMMTEFVPGGAEGNFSFLVEARINTAAAEKWELQYYRLRLAQG